MNLEQLQHVIRAASRVVGVPDVVVIGSQALLGTFRDAAALPIEATRSREADLAFDPEIARLGDDASPSDLADQIDGALGEHSQFDAMYGYYAQGVEVTTAVLAPGWRGRLVPLICDDDQPEAVGWCLEVHDLWASKAAAARQKDFEFCAALVESGLVDEPTCRARIETFTGPEALRAQRVAARCFR